MDLEFSGEIWHWRGPSPYHFVTVPDEDAAHLDWMLDATAEIAGRIAREVSERAATA